MAAKSGAKKKTTGKNTGKKRQNNKNQKILQDEIIILAVLAICIFLMVSNFGVGGLVGDVISGILFGIFGWLAYLIPILIFGVCALLVSNKGSTHANIKATAAGFMMMNIDALLTLWTGSYVEGGSLLSYYTYATNGENPGGFLGGFLDTLFCPLLGVVGTNIVVIILLAICIILVTERSLLKPIGNHSKKMYEGARKRHEVSAAKSAQRREERRKEIVEAKEDTTKKERKKSNVEQKRERNVRRMDKKVSGVSFATTLKEKKAVGKSPEVVELVPDPNLEMEPLDEMKAMPELFDQFVINRPEETKIVEHSTEEAEGFIEPEVVKSKEKRKSTSEKEKQEIAQETANVEETIKAQENEKKPVYKKPPINLLTRGKKSSGDSDAHLRETARKLEQTFQNFGVKVHVTNASCGPSVTRYELQPEQGVKVSKIVNLQDDIKLNLAVTDLRIEAPIPGKAAVGIEVPNAENSAVMLRDLLETEEFQESESKVSFAVGKDISGRTIVTDIAKMPHVLVAGATGSGKSVCINTLIMSILYKADPDEVKMIMVDPKVVELSVYNGIPHLLIPVITDPRKAAGALNWAVAEMMKRYQMFTEYKVRDLKGFNDKIAHMKPEEGKEIPKKMPQIVIIVDELADLMMVASKDVESAICRLAQLARAAGMHLVLATQRPSVDVITGLIKANMPSRIAFAVSSSIDSRTILDMNGAEKLLGKGDMLFYPTGYPQPVRVQGSFVSDKEVQRVVDYLIDNNGGVSYSKELEEQMKADLPNIGGTTTISLTEDHANDKDHYFEDAGRLIIDKEKASIGMLQRMFKIGFNRAARIMDQLAEAGVVGPEEGTKPRKVLMTKEEFEQYLSENK